MHYFKHIEIYYIIEVHREMLSVEYNVQLQGDTKELDYSTAISDKSWKSVFNCGTHY